VADDARLDALEAENERLRDELEALKASLGLRFLAPVEMGLTGHETKMFGRLLRGDAVSKDGLMNAVYTVGIDDQPEIKIIDVFICKIRKKLKPFGIEIATIWGVGYQMTAQSVASFKERWPACLPSATDGVAA
jgi:two-component system cell cycle response regulator CtrA